MAKLYLTFEGRPLKEFTLSHGVLTIGRLPDNLVQVDNLAVSGHHAKVYWDAEHYVVEDNQSTNGTYVNEQRITKIALNDGDKILIGKHTLQFADEWHEDGAPDAEAAKAGPVVPAMHATVMLDTKKAKELLAQAKASPAAMAETSAAAAAAAPSSAPAAHQPAAPASPATGPTGTAFTPAPVLKDRTAMLVVIDGKTDQKQYTLTGKLTVIGKSDMATIKLKGWFTPAVAAIITRREGGYHIAPQDKGAKLKINGADAPGQHDLHEGDTIEVSGVKMSFTLE